jgi:hypothetical protein
MREISVDVARLPRFLAFYEKDSEDSVDCFLVVIGRHVPPVAGSVLETQSVHPQASVFPVETLVPLPTLWHFDGAGIGLQKGRRRRRWNLRASCPSSLYNRRAREGLQGILESYPTGRLSIWLPTTRVTCTRRPFSTDEERRAFARSTVDSVETCRGRSCPSTHGNSK